tara:strand:+ start:263 stop:1204 length:942 start_codon:yes stop_codon:yes gene_type:complete
MSFDNFKKDVSKIYDFNPDWLNRLKYNPMKALINEAKTYHLLNVLFKLYGSLRINPIIKEINFYHYKQPYVSDLLRNVKSINTKISSFDGACEDNLLNILALLAKLDYFYIYSKNETEGLIKNIFAVGFLEKSENILYLSKLLYYLMRLGYKNMFIERALNKVRKYQKLDGGWPIRFNSKNNNSDVFATLTIHRTFLENNLWINKDFLNKSEQFLNSSFLSKSNTKLELDRWNRIYSGYKKNNIFEGGSVLLLDSLLIKDSNSYYPKSIISWLKVLQLKNGFFPYHARLRNQLNFTSTINILYLFKKYHLYHI